MTASLARQSSGSEFPWQLVGGEIDIWLCTSDHCDSETMARMLLARYTGLPPADLQIERGEYGKPYLVNARSTLQFSLSHSGDWLGCAIAMDNPLGLDLECHDSRRDIMPLARRYYGEAEYRDLTALPMEERTARFYDLWTLKEAHVKARGSSLGKELERTHYHFGETDRGLPVIMPSTGSRGAFYGLLSVIEGYSLALAVMTTPAQQPRLRAVRRFGSDSRSLASRWTALSSS